MSHSGWYHSGLVVSVTIATGQITWIQAWKLATMCAIFHNPVDYNGRSTWTPYGDSRNNRGYCMYRILRGSRAIGCQGGSCWLLSHDSRFGHNNPTGCNQLARKCSCVYPEGGCSSRIIGRTFNGTCMLISDGLKGIRAWSLLQGNGIVATVSLGASG